MTNFAMSVTGVTGTQCAPNTPCPATAVPSGVADDTTETAGTRAVIVADAANNTVQEQTSAPAAGTPALLASGCIPAAVSVGAAAATHAPLFVACPGTGTVEKGLITTGAISGITAVALGHGGAPASCTGSNTPAPYGVATNETTSGGNWSGSVVVTDSANNALDVYTLGGPDTAAPTLTGPTCVATGSVPDGVAMDTVGANSFAFVANEGGNSITVVDPPAGQTTPATIVTTPKSNGLTVTNHPLVAPLKNHLKKKHHKRKVHHKRKSHHHHRKSLHRL
jgi:hypothetical protein